MDLKNQMHCELAKANTMDHGGVIICFDDSEVSYRDVRCVFYTKVVSFIDINKGTGTRSQLYFQMSYTYSCIECNCYCVNVATMDIAMVNILWICSHEMPSTNSKVCKYGWCL